MNTTHTPGPGDEQTWSPCLGHSLDPRTPDDDDERRTAINEAIRTLWLAEAALAQLDAEDDKLFLRVDKLMADAAEYLIDAMDNARAAEIERMTRENAELRARLEARPMRCAKLWVGHGKYTRTGAPPAVCVTYHASGKLRSYMQFRPDVSVSELDCLDAPDQICTGSVRFSHDDEDNVGWMFASEHRA